MRARNHALMILAMALVSCKPFKGEVINNVGQGVYIQIYDRSGNLDAYGQLKSGQTLTLNSEINDIGIVRYRYGNISCDLRADNIRDMVEWDDEFWRITVKRC